MASSLPRLSQLSGYYEVCYALLDELGGHAEGGELHLDLPCGSARARIRFGKRGRWSQDVWMEQLPLAQAAEGDGKWRELSWQMRISHDFRVAEVVRFCNRNPGCNLLPRENLARKGLLPDDRLQQNRFAAEWMAHCLRLAREALKDEAGGAGRQLPPPAPPRPR